MSEHKLIDTRSGWVNKEDFREFGIFATTLTMRREPKDGDIFITISTDLVTDYQIYRETKPKENAA